jgi:hypothetical protein
MIDSTTSLITTTEQVIQFMQLLPTPAIIIDYRGGVIDFNKHALDFFNFSNKEQYFNNLVIPTVFVDPSLAMKNILEMCTIRSSNAYTIVLRKSDKSVESVNLFASYITQDRELILIQFTQISEKNKTVFNEFKQSFKNDVLKLKPYLNKPGRELLEQILENNGIEEQLKKFKVSKSNSDYIPKDRLDKIHYLFPAFTNQELSLCGFLSLNLTIDEIAALTGKTSNCLRVLFHRLLQKTEYSSGKDFIRNLKLID